ARRADEGGAGTDAEPTKKPKLIPTPITPYYSPLISRMEMGLQRSTVRRQSGGPCIVNGGWVRGWEIPVRAGPRKPPAGLRSVPQGKSLQWRDLRREGHERYARMADAPRRIASRF